jgi:hypothetical protein
MKEVSQKESLFVLSSERKELHPTFQVDERRRPRGVGITAWSPPRGGGWVQ